MPTGARVASVLVAVAAVAAAVAAAPSITETKRERASAEERRAAAVKRERRAADRALQRPLRARLGAVDRPSAPAAERRRARLRAAREARALVLADARRRHPQRIRRIDCERYPRSTVVGDPARDLRLARGRYACLAITADLPDRKGVIGYPYRVLVGFRDGTTGYCRTSGRPGEGLLNKSETVTIPRACGGL